ncbi:MAG: polyphosphate polymerase domain-containing protein [Lachnospiraceae bacterium]|nr:polyphosphate polymerase domain-containing protein [Lachnospiraceae bacterium]
MDGYRKELKYIVGDDVMLDCRCRIASLMKKDAHQSGSFYRIRSVYFDSPSHTCFYENAAGVSTREKYRIRTYNCRADLAIAEIKIRHRETISKMSAKISEQMADALISGGGAVRILSEAISERKKEGREDEARVFEKYLAKISTLAYRPSVIVDYERDAYVYDIGNVRITFDRNVFGSQEYSRFFDENLTGRPALDGREHILEIKYDEFLPDEIVSVLGGLGLQRTSSSKYAACLARFI